jgi:hypothetical protein
VRSVTLLVGLSGPNGTLEPGDTYECDEAEAIRMISSRFAVPVAGRAIERAVEVPATETRRGRKRKE